MKRIIGATMLWAAVAATGACSTAGDGPVDIVSTGGLGGGGALGGGAGMVPDDPGAKPNHLTDHDLEGDGDANKMFWRWVVAAQNDFAARMDWCVASSFGDANHRPVARVAGGRARTVSPGAIVALDATATTDPDGDRMTYRWWQYAAADSAQAAVAISNSSSMGAASFVVPDEPGRQVHVILEATDDGSPPLKGYQRIIFTIGAT